MGGFREEEVLIKPSADPRAPDPDPLGEGLGESREGSNGAAGDRLTVEQWLETRPIGALQWLVLVASSAIMLVDGFDLQALALAIPALSRDWGVAPERLSWALSISLVGMGAGAAIFGMAGDRYGRKLLIWTSLLTVATSCGATAFATTLPQAAVLRLVTGLGIGAANINALALTTDYAPPRRRFLMMMLMGCNVAVGAALAGLVAPSLIAVWGWAGIFVAGAALAGAMALIVLAAMPESLSHATRHWDGGRLARLTRRIEPAFDPQRLLPPKKAGARRFAIVELLAPGLRARTLTIWVLYILGSFTLYLLISWLPILLIRAGWTEAAALRGSVTIQLGGILGSIVAAVFIDRGHLAAALIAGYALAAAGVLLLLAMPPSVLLWSVLIFLIGAGVAGTQLILIGAAAALYPSDLRASSAGTATFVARIGAIAAPLVGGLALAARVDPATIIGWLALPMLVQTGLLIATRHSFAMDASHRRSR